MLSFTAIRSDVLEPAASTGPASSSSIKVPAHRHHVGRCRHLLNKSTFIRSTRRRRGHFRNLPGAPSLTQDDRPWCQSCPASSRSLPRPLAQQFRRSLSSRRINVGDVSPSFQILFRTCVLLLHSHIVQKKRSRNPEVVRTRVHRIAVLVVLVLWQI